MRKATTFLATIALTAAFAPAAFGSDIVGIYNPSTPSNSGSSCNVANQCTFFQGSDSGGNSYVVPSDGVITSYEMIQGANRSGTNTAQLRVFRPAAGSTWDVVGESPVTALYVVGSPINDTFPARVPVKAGDHIGVTVNFAGDTAWQYSTGSGTDTVAQVSGLVPALGQNITPFNLLGTANRRLNLQATVEPDADGDGYGDETQDLCPGDPAHGATGCSGYVVGSDFQHPRSGSAGCGVPPCVSGNTLLPSGNARVRARGVLVRWRMLAPLAAGTYTMRVLRPSGSNALGVADTTPFVLSGSENGIITSGPQRIPVEAGDWLGVLSSTGANYAEYSRPGMGDWSFMLPAPAVGSTGTPITISPDVEILQGADVEADADGDGYGDETQDRCPTDPTVQTTCPKPTISGLKVKPRRFKHGKLTKFLFNLSIASRVDYVVSAQKIGRAGAHGCGAPSKKTRKNRRCKYYKQARRFSTAASAGANAVPFNAKKLPPGAYRVTLTPSSSLSHVLGTPASAKFTIAR